MQYILVQNKQTLLLGPMNWRPRFFQSEINDLVDNGDLTTDWTAPPVEPGYVDLGSGFELFPVVDTTKPEFDNDFEQLAGPFFTYSDNGAHESYTTIAHGVDTVKNNLKDLAAKVRYHKESSLDSIAKVQIQGKTVSVATNTDAMHKIVHQHVAMADGSVANVKFPEGWVQASKSDLGKIVADTHAHLQKFADWEHAIHVKIEAASTTNALKDIKVSELVTRKLGA